MTGEPQETRKEARGTRSERLDSWRDALANDDEYEMAERLITMPAEMQTPWLGVRLIRMQAEMRGGMSEVYDAVEEVRNEMREALRVTPTQRAQAVFTAIGAGFGGAFVMGVYLMAQVLGLVKT